VQGTSLQRLHGCGSASDKGTISQLLAQNHIIIQLAEAYTNREQYIKQRIEVHLRRKKD
jgi:hypothetical protein